MSLVDSDVVICLIYNISDNRNWHLVCEISSSLMMEAVRTSETSVDNHSTRQYNPEDSSEHDTWFTAQWIAMLIRYLLEKMADLRHKLLPAPLSAGTSVYTRTQRQIKGPGEERVKSIFIHFPFSLPSSALKLVLSNSINRIWKNELHPKI
jgi:hypothetical protein